MNTNVNPETGIRYGIINLSSLEDWVYDEITTLGEDVAYKQALEELTLEARSKVAAEFPGIDLKEYQDRIDEIVAEAHEELNMNYCESDSTYEFNIDGVKGRLDNSLGGQLVWVFESPVISKARLCSPCVPNCGDLDALSSSGFDCYDVPAEWRRAED